MVGDKKSIEQYEHKGKTRCNNPQVGIADAEIDTEENGSYTSTIRIWTRSSGGRARWRT